jgi:hypothetical protein
MEELDKVKIDTQKKGIGIYDQEHKLRIDPEALAFFNQNGDENKAKPRTKVELTQDLVALERIFKKKYGSRWADPYDIRLYGKDPAKFVEMLIRATEICTLNYVLRTGLGALNKNNSTIVKGNKHFIWEHD